jgi:hypothetical protein
VVVVVTWNVQNLFSTGEFAASTVAVYEAKLDGVATTLVANNVDAARLQEVGDGQAFRRPDGPSRVGLARRALHVCRSRAAGRHRRPRTADVNHL